MSATGRLVRHIVSLRYEDLPPAAIEAAKILALDTLGVCVSGSAAPYAAAVGATAARWGAGEEAHVLGRGEALPAPSAAFVNAYQAHSQEWDCVHEAAVVHSLATVQSALCAAAERRGGLSGRDFILALAAGVDASSTIGMGSRAPLKFFRPATAGTFGVAAALAKLEGFDEAALRDALGLAFSQAAGTMQAHVEGRPTLALQVAMATRAGMNAVDLAAAGFPGPHDMLEGPFGFYAMMEGAWDAAPFEALGRVSRIAEVSIKPFPTGRANHAGIDGIQRLLAAERIEADEVEKLTLLAPPLIRQLVGRPYRDDMTVSYARLCFQYVGALALRFGTVDAPDFRPERLADPAMRDLAQRVEVAVDDNPDPNALVPQTVRVLLRSGRVREMRVEHMLGSPANPLTAAQREDKFRRAWSQAARKLDPARADRAIALAGRLQTLGDVRELFRLALP
jgi:2-methylcitrate dehydratase PrpD